MTVLIKKKLNVFKIILSGINLIEASAGTGKTFTIVLLYLRCLLGIGKKTYQKKLLIHEILVLTFTNAAKEELYIRLQEGINNLYLSCINKRNEDPICQLFLNEIQDTNAAIKILKIAKNNIHDASIYTIDSFCQNILQSNTFDIYYTFHDKIIENEDHLYLKTTEDFWRLYVYTLPENIIKIILQYSKSPKDLLKIIKPFIDLDSVNFNKKIFNNESLILLHEKNIKQINYFKKKWLTHSYKILKIINHVNINKKIYHDVNISRWINYIDKWSKSQTQDYNIPIILKYFTQNYIKKNTIDYIDSKCIIFNEIEKILKYNFSLKHIFILHAIQKIKKLLIKEKKKQSLFGFNDILNLFLKILKKEKNLRKLIRKKYPIAFIDEFQDTNIKQYKIFNILYKNSKKLALFLIGDPKQAIYSFRGADIFSYLHITSKIKKHYYLDTNWRSSVNMCNSINFLFSQNSNPFIFKDISYIPIIASQKNSKMQFIVNGISQVPIRFFLYEKTETSLDEYQIWIAKQCAQKISYWLTCAQNGKAKIITQKTEKILSSNDIAILVKNKKEADIIKKELHQLNISSIYFSERNSVFKIFDAQELLWILECVLEPDNIKLLQQAMSTHIFQVIASTIQKKNKTQSYLMIEKLYAYYAIWNDISIFHLIQNMILEYQKHATLTELNTNYIKNLNFLHIAEILQEQYQYFNKKISLIRWFQKKISEIKEPVQNEYIRNYQECQLVKIITIHKSKGLEYPIIWIPFMVNFNQSSSYIHHNNNEVIINIQSNKKYFKIADKERLAEDMRLLYVAITRSMLHCCIGLSCLIKQRKKNRIHSDIHISSIGYLIQNGKSMNYEDLLKKINQLSINNLLEVKNNTKKFVLSNTKNIYLINQPIYFNQKHQYIWNITSFTKLKKENNFFENKKSTILYNQYNTEIFIKKNKKLTVNNFPKGKKTGLMMHFILKNLYILNYKDNNFFSNILEKYNISLKWTKTLISWIKNILHISLDNQNMRLSTILKQSCIKELEFFLPIKQILYNAELNKIMQCFNPISFSTPKLLFNPTKGILNGCIDLFFIWDKKYYILDYKSNWLGDNNSFYAPQNIRTEMIKNRYDFQYQIYTIAVHKYLKQKLKNYHYENDFGGVFYVFLRAIEDQKKHHGIFYIKPDYLLIKKIIDLIS
ncbi:exodeoxyribonuclease V subunit beta [Buchnera aphidicola]|uniref:RecBCD enzyme subunit RecB n=1 Tax=Buchnera aphidicola str. Ua (Uroleucon ambrosiae) TaxID=1005057 RepID=G2LPU5_BUCUM|nr:exodeoxyribonuclease V subunit beta [Buchnera aphidicola]AEO08232.1 exodeoxyribonuclease V 135 kDa polypeptide [Buchnera aphidicola str. Ua (Uroleucon ambrosiae)]